MELLVLRLLFEGSDRVGGAGGCWKDTGTVSGLDPAEYRVSEDSTAVQGVAVGLIVLLEQVTEVDAFMVEIDCT